MNERFARLATSSCAAVVAATLAFGPTAAQTPPPAVPFSSPVPSASPVAPTREAAREQTALKIAGLVVFVANSCKKLRPDYARFKSIIHDLGVSEEKLAQPETKSRYLSYTAAYQADVTVSCARGMAQFGPKGSTLPELFILQ